MKDNVTRRMTRAAPEQGGRRTATRAAALVRTSKARAEGHSVDAISERVLNAIMEHRLPPGTKLIEERLAEIFGVSRTKIRQALGGLAHDGVLSVFPNRGTFVASPSIDEARQVFDARRLIEPGIVRTIAAAPARDDLARLRRITRTEAAARTANDRRATIRLSGEFHIELAGLTGNAFIVKTIRELALLTCLIIALYDSPAMRACPHHEHEDLIDAIQNRDAAKAASLMITHLNHVEHALELRPPATGEIDLEAALG